MTLIVKKTPNVGMGVFTDRSYEKGDVLLKFSGKSLTLDQINKLTKWQQANVLQVGDNNYLDLTGETAFFFNHSCNANCYVKVIVNTAFLIALRPIKSEEEITFDYSLTSTDTEDSWIMKCKCHRFYCRGEISGFQTLPEKKKKELIDNKLVPKYVKKDD